MKTPVEIKALTDEQLCHELTETRITIESIRPYKCKDVSKYRAQLNAEWLRRRSPPSLTFKP